MKEDFNILHNTATQAAVEACQAVEERSGGHWWPCGFAWVNVRPATQPFARWLKKAGIVEWASYQGGYDIWNPSNNPTQSMDAKEAGARAYARVLQDKGIHAYAQSRMD